MTDVADILKKIQSNPKPLLMATARVRFLNFSRYMQPSMEVEPFHKVLYEVLDMFAHGKIKKLMITVPPQHGKLLADSTLIATPKGFRRHGDLKVGDFVYGRDGKPVKVLWVSEKTMSEYDVTFSDGSVIQCHGNHEWVVYDRGMGAERKVETKYLFNSKLDSGLPGKRGHRYRFQVDANVAIDFPEKNFLIHPYVLGAWLGDGSGGKGCITHHKDDVKHIKRICDIGYFINNQQIHPKTGVYTTYFADLYSQLKEVGLKKGKFIPEIYFNSSVAQRLSLLAGLIDTDGYIYHKNGRVTFSNANKQLIDDVKRLVLSLGCRVTVCSFEPVTSTSGIVGKKVIYQLCFNPNFAIPCVLDRKKSVNFTPTIKRRAIVSVKKAINPEQGNCIQVEGGIYLAGETLIPTHNSEASSRKLPAFMLGLNPNLKIAIGSYESTTAQGFNKDVQRNIDSDEYRELFPKTYINGSGKQSFNNVFARNNKLCEIVGHRGSIVAVGRSGALTSKTVDVMIMDDLYKDFEEGNSPVIREKAWKWYTSVVKTRLHNNSQELMLFTRWHEDDLIGRLEIEEQVIEIKSLSELSSIPQGAWVKINFEAIKDTEPSELDPREPGDALWANRHSRTTLEEKRAIDKLLFDCLYQGKPASKEGMLYQSFKEYFNVDKVGVVIGKGNYTDVADEGSDYLCSVCYDVVRTNKVDEKGKPFIAICVTDVIYTQEPVEVTSETVPAMMDRNRTRYANIESNNGGKAFSIIIQKKTKAQINWFHQSGNKESRIMTNAGLVMQHIMFPPKWQTRWPRFYSDLISFKKHFAANKHDDAADCVSGIVEKEILRSKSGKGLKRKN